MAVKSNNKRKAQPTQGASKKRKITNDTGSKKPSSKSKAKGKEKAADRVIIPIPAYDEEIELSDEDLDAFEDYGDAVGFLSRLDEKGIARSKTETERLHRLHKPVRVAPQDDLPSVDSHDEDEDDWGSSIGEETEDEDEDLDDTASAGMVSDSGASSSSSIRGPRKKPKAGSDEEEMSYEVMPRKRRPSWEPEEKTEKGVERLPIKLSDGRIQKSKDKVILDAEETEESEDYPEEDEPIPEYKVEDVSTGARFGRPAVVDVIGNKSRKARIQGAKEQLAGICQEIVAEPENSVIVSATRPFL